MVKKSIKTDWFSPDIDILNVYIREEESMQNLWELLADTRPCWESIDQAERNAIKRNAIVVPAPYLSEETFAIEEMDLHHLPDQGIRTNTISL